MGLLRASEVKDIRGRRCILIVLASLSSVFDLVRILHRDEAP